MTDREDIDVVEDGFRRRWHRVHIDRFTADTDGTSWREKNIAPYADRGRRYLDALRQSRDLDRFQADTGAWVGGFASGFKGAAGQMVVNQINKNSSDPDASVTVLLDALTTPADLADAMRKVRLLADHLREFHKDAQLSPRRAPFVASYYWGLAEPGDWPVAWPKSTDYLGFVTGVSGHDDQGERYAELYRFAMEVDGDPLRFEQVAAWWADEKPVLVDAVLCDRAVLREGAKKGGDDPEPGRDNAQALATVARYIGKTLKTGIRQVVDPTAEANRSAMMRDGVWPRGGFWVDWLVPGSRSPTVRLWLNGRGLAIGLHLYRDPKSVDAARIANLIESRRPPGYELLTDDSGANLFARRFDRAALSSVDVPAEVLKAARELVPILSELTGRTAADDGDELAADVAEFKKSVGYPTPGHEQDRADRRDFAKLLDPENLSTVDRAELRRIWNSGRYGSTGPMSVLNTTLRDADDAQYERIIETIHYLCWGEDPPATRIDRVLDDTDPLRVKGFGESVVMKLLAITHPEQFITVYPYKGQKGKRRMLELLELPAEPTSSRGESQVDSNDALRTRLDRHFPGDPLGIGAFLYWYAERDEEPAVQPEMDPLDALSEELLVGRDFIDDVVSLLEDKKQVVFYGPPGTGKTYFARKLAEALVPDAERRPIVQFHPSTSYEDFFEGYRPDPDANGAMRYRLQPGPLARLAARASDAPGRRHLMIIDEINRANLPKVLGELLFLFEYRDTPVRTLYRPDDPFELSKDIWFIGTMNTADRSIALVDAALRRRFHFVPFFPGHGEMAGLLGRWLDREGEPEWVGELVARVNEELTEELGGPHLQLGASHFMKRGLDESALRRIWEYDIEPFIEDQFFGDATQIERFRFERVWNRYKYLADETLTAATGGDEPEA